MIFDRSFRQELARSFSATTVILFTIVLTMLLIRTLGLAAKGNFNPNEIITVLGFSILGRAPTLLTLSLFVAIIASLSRMYRDSEMVVWFASGQSLRHFLRPVLRFSWPILLAIAVLVMVIWPWSNAKIDQLSQRFVQRSNVERIQPGVFQESADGRSTFFIEKPEGDNSKTGHVFVAHKDKDGVQTLSFAQEGKLIKQGDGSTIRLSQGQHLKIGNATQDNVSHAFQLTQFEVFELQSLPKAPKTWAGSTPLKATSTWRLIEDGSLPARAELGWRLGQALVAFNFVLIAVAISTSNPRAGRSGNLLFALFAFMLYYNLLNVSQNWIATGKYLFWPTLLVLHVGAFALAMWGLYRRQGGNAMGWRSALQRLLPQGARV